MNERSTIDASETGTANNASTFISFIMPKLDTPILDTLHRFELPNPMFSPLQYPADQS